MTETQREALAVLREVWGLSPDVRLGQLMAQLGFLGEVHERGCEMNDDDSRTCVECQGRMSPIILMDKTYPMPSAHRYTTTLEYRLPDDRLSFWTGKYPTAGTVLAFICEECGRIALYGGKPDA